MRVRSVLWMTFVCCFVLVSMVAGCGGKKEPSPKEDTFLEITFVADPNLNPSVRGRPSPLSVRVFELNATDVFEEADYFALQIDAKKTLGETLLPGGEKFVIRPGARKEIQLKANPALTALGFVAGYRNLEESTWQAVHVVPPPPEVGLFSSALTIVLEVLLRENDIQVRLVR